MFNLNAPFLLLERNCQITLPLQINGTKYASFLTLIDLIWRAK